MSEIFSGRLVRLDLREGSNLHRLHLVGDDGRRWVVEVDQPQSGFALTFEARFIMGDSPLESAAIGVRISSDQ